MIIKLIEKILVKMLFLIRKRRKEEKPQEIKSPNRVAMPSDFGIYTSWKPSQETLREYEIRNKINTNTPETWSPYAEHSNSSMRDVITEAIVGGVVEVIVEENYEEVKDKITDLFEDIKEEVEDTSNL